MRPPFTTCAFHPFLECSAIFIIVRAIEAEAFLCIRIIIIVNIFFCTSYILFASSRVCFIGVSVNIDVLRFLFLYLGSGFLAAAFGDGFKLNGVMGGEFSLFLLNRFLEELISFELTRLSS